MFVCMHGMFEDIFNHARKNLFLLLVLCFIFWLYFIQFSQAKHFYYLFNADFLHIVFFSKSVFSQPENLSYWYTTPSPYIFPDVLVFGFLDTIFSQQTTYIIILFLNFLLFNIALLRLHKLFFPFSNITLILFNVIVLLLFYYSGTDSFLYLHQFIPVNHLSAFICFALLLKKEIKINAYFPIWLVLILCISFSDPVFLMYFLPMQIILSYKTSPKPLLLTSVSASIIGLVLFKLAYSYKIIRASNDQTEVSVDIIKSFNHFFDNIQLLSSSVTFIIFLACVFVAVFAWKSKHAFIIYYLIFGVPFLVCLIGYMAGPDTFRYFTGSLFFGLLVGLTILVGRVSAFLDKINFNNKYILISTFCVVLVVYVRAYIKDDFALNKPEHIVCIESFAKDNQIDYVITDYWNAKQLMFFNAGLKVFPLTDILQPNFHEADVRIFDSIKSKDNLKMVAFTSGLNIDSLNLYRDYSILAVKCYQDSLFVLDKNPLR